MCFLPGAIAASHTGKAKRRARALASEIGRAARLLFQTTVGEAFAPLEVPVKPEFPAGFPTGVRPRPYCPQTSRRLLSPIKIYLPDISRLKRH